MQPLRGGYPEKINLRGHARGHSLPAYLQNWRISAACELNGGRRRAHQTLVSDRLTRPEYRTLADITTPSLVALLRKIEKRAAIHTAQRLRQHISAVFGNGIAEGLRQSDPAGTHVVNALLPTSVGGSQPGLGSIPEIVKLHATTGASTGGALTKLASRLPACPSCGRA